MKIFALNIIVIVHYIEYFKIVVILFHEFTLYKPSNLCIRGILSVP